MKVATSEEHRLTPFEPLPIPRRTKKSFIFKGGRPKSSFLGLSLLLGVFGLLFFILGIVVLVQSRDSFEFEVRYDQTCKGKPICADLIIPVTEKILKPVYVQYRVVEFYQNHLKYIRSIPVAQLRDQVLYNAADLEDCAPYLTNRNMSKLTSMANTTLEPNAPAIPCGLAAYTFFNDTFELTNLNTSAKVNISDKGIAWDSDKTYKFKNVDLAKQWIDLENNERFVNWMKVAPFQNFIKSWGVINEDLEPGVYQLSIANTWNSEIFGGQKHFILRQATFIGGKNYFVGSVFIVAGIFALAAIAVMSTFKLTYKQKTKENVF